MNKFIGIFVIIIFFLQFSFFPFLELNINFLLALVMILAQRRFNFSGIFWIFICGILADIFSVVFGLNLMGFVFIALLVNFITNYFVTFEGNRFTGSLIYLGGKVFFDLLKYFFGLIFVQFGFIEKNIINFPDFFSLKYFLSVVFFGVISVLLLSIYEKMEKMSGEKIQTLIINNK